MVEPTIGAAEIANRRDRVWATIEVTVDDTFLHRR